MFGSGRYKKYKSYKGWRGTPARWKRWRYGRGRYGRSKRYRGSGSIFGSLFSNRIDGSGRYKKRRRRRGPSLASLKKKVYGMQLSALKRDRASRKARSRGVRHALSSWRAANVVNQPYANAAVAQGALDLVAKDPRTYEMAAGS